MPRPKWYPFLRAGLALAALAVEVDVSASSPLQGAPPVDVVPAMPRTPAVNPNDPAPPVAPNPSTILAGEVQPIDLGSALRLAGLQNPGLLLARQLVVEAVAERQFAAAQILPTLNSGASYDAHTGNLQQSSGNILSVNRSSVYVGSGAFAVAAGTVSIPGVVLTGNVAEGLYRYLATRQVIVQREFANAAATNNTLLRVATDYCELIRAEGRRAVAEQLRDQADEVARITAAYARTGEGRLADADRARTEFARRKADVRQAEGEILIASARLCRTLNLDPSIRLHPTDAYAAPMSIIPDPIPLCELITMAVLKRPELGERRAALRESLLFLDGAKVLPFSPTILIGLSGAGFGGGSNLVRPNFGNFGDRADFDAVAYWTLRNFGVGNIALVKIARAQASANKFREVAVLDMVRDEVAEAYARTHARFAQIGDEEQAVLSASEGFRLDLERIKQGVPGQGNNPRPIEVLDSLNLLRQSKFEYLDAIIDYNQAHFQLYVALGQPPAANLAHAAPAGNENPGSTAPMSPPSQAPPAHVEHFAVRATRFPALIYCIILCPSIGTDLPRRGHDDPGRPKFGCGPTKGHGPTRRDRRIPGAGVRRLPARRAPRPRRSAPGDPLWRQGTPSRSRTAGDAAGRPGTLGMARARVSRRRRRQGLDGGLGDTNRYLGMAVAPSPIDLSDRLALGHPAGRVDQSHHR